jgi:hypothetical protein
MTGVSWRDIALCICAACLLMIVGACLGFLFMHFSWTRCP